MSAKNHNVSWIYVPNCMKDEIQSNIKQMKLPQIKQLLKEYKKDNPKVFLTGTKAILTDQALRILDQGFKPVASDSISNLNSNSNTNSASNYGPSKASCTSSSIFRFDPLRSDNKKTAKSKKKNPKSSKKGNKVKKDEEIKSKKKSKVVIKLVKVAKKTDGNKQIKQIEPTRKIAIFLCNEYDIDRRAKYGLNTTKFDKLDALLQGTDMNIYKLLNSMNIKQGKVLGYCTGGDGDPFVVNKIANDYHEGDIMFHSFSGFSEPSWYERFGYHRKRCHATFRHVLCPGWGGEPSVYQIFPFIQVNVTDKQISKIRKLYS